MFYIAVAAVGFVVLGTAGYMFVENWGLMDAFYMTIISLTTVGYGEVQQLSATGKLFTSLLLLMGIGTVFYATAHFAEAMVEGRLRNVLGRRIRVRELKNLSNHNIICGHGRIGFVICRELSRHDAPFVIIDNSAEKVSALIEQGFLAIQGDATDDAVLVEAGIERAKSLICTLGTDAENVFVTLSAKKLNPGLFIVSRAVRQSSISKLELAGANRVVSPYTMGGMRMVETILRPKLAGFLDEIVGFSTADLDFESVPVLSGSRLVGSTLRDSRISQETGVNLLAVRQESGNMKLNPGPDFVLTEGDHLYALGTSAQVGRLRKYIAGDAEPSR